MTSKVILYKNNNGTLKVLVENENVWMTQEQIGDLFGKSQKTISEHINNIYEDGELNNSITMQKISNSGKTGNSFTKPTNYYNIYTIQELKNLN